MSQVPLYIVHFSMHEVPFLMHEIPLYSVALSQGPSTVHVLDFDFTDIATMYSLPATRDKTRTCWQNGAESGRFLARRDLTAETCSGLRKAEREIHRTSGGCHTGLPRPAERAARPPFRYKCLKRHFILFAWVASY